MLIQFISKKWYVILLVNNFLYILMYLSMVQHELLQTNALKSTLVWISLGVFSWAVLLFLDHFLQRFSCELPAWQSYLQISRVRYLILWKRSEAGFWNISALFLYSFPLTVCFSWFVGRICSVFSHSLWLSLSHVLYVITVAVLCLELHRGKYCF